MRILACVLLVACTHTTPIGPTAIARFVEPAAWTEDDTERVERGLATWRKLGFDTAVEVETDLPLCPNDWYLRIPQLTACAIIIALRKEPGLIQRYNHYAQTDRATDTTTIDASVHGDRLTNVMAHEAGHILLNTSKHTTYGSLAPGGDHAFVSGADKELACETIGRGCRMAP